MRAAQRVMPRRAAAGAVAESCAASARSQAGDIALVDRHTKRCRNDAQEHTEYPHDAIGTGQIEHQAPVPGAEEASDLMPEKRDAEERRQVLHTEYLCDQPVREWNRAKPGNTHRNAETPDRRSRQRQRNE